MSQQITVEAAALLVSGMSKQHLDLDPALIVILQTMHVATLKLDNNKIKPFSDDTKSNHKFHNIHSK